VAPLALSLSVSPSSAPANTHLTFTATPSPGAIIERYVWNFGDGSGEVQTGAVAARSYATPGTRVVTVTAYPFGSGTPATAIAQVQITN
jgi:hypothetical protein